MPKDLELFYNYVIETGRKKDPLRFKPSVVNPQSPAWLQEAEQETPINYRFPELAALIDHPESLLERSVDDYIRDSGSTEEKYTGKTSLEWGVMYQGESINTHIPFTSYLIPKDIVYYYRLRSGYRLGCKIDLNRRLFLIVSVNEVTDPKIIRNWPLLSDLRVDQPVEMIDIVDQCSWEVYMMYLIAPQLWGSGTLIMAPGMAGKSRMLRALLKSIVKILERDDAYLVFSFLDRPGDYSMHLRVLDAIPSDRIIKVESAWDKDKTHTIDVLRLTRDFVQSLMRSGKRVIWACDAISKAAVAFNLSKYVDMNTGILSLGLSADVIVRIGAEIFGTYGTFYPKDWDLSVVKPYGELTVIGTAIYGDRVSEAVYATEAGDPTTTSVLYLEKGPVLPQPNLKTSGTRGSPDPERNPIPMYWERLMKAAECYRWGRMYQEDDDGNDHRVALRRLRAYCKEKEAGVAPNLTDWLWDIPIGLSNYIDEVALKYELSKIDLISRSVEIFRRLPEFKGDRPLVYARSDKDGIEITSDNPEDMLIVKSAPSGPTVEAFLGEEVSNSLHSIALQRGDQPVDVLFSTITLFDTYSREQRNGYNVWVHDVPNNCLLAYLKLPVGKFIQSLKKLPTPPSTQPTGEGS